MSTVTIQPFILCHNSFIAKARWQRLPVIITKQGPFHPTD